MATTDLSTRPSAAATYAQVRKAARGVRMKLKGEGRFAGVRGAILSAVFWTTLPAALVAAYLYGFAADQYVSEAQFVVRGNTVSVGGEAGGTIGGIIEVNTSQDTRIAADYLASGAVIGDLAGRFDLATMFSAPAPDLFAGVSSGASPEAIGDYWRRTMTSEVDVVSGIITLRLRAFSRDDALALAGAAVAATEEKLNALHRLTLEGAARLAADRARAAEIRLIETRREIREFRERYRAIDLRAGAASTFELLTELRRQRIEGRAELAVLRAQGAGNAPAIRAMEARIAALDRQIASLEQELTGAMEGDDAAATAAIEAYDRLMLRQEMASRYVARSAAAAARADLKLEQRQVYLDVFVPPATAEDAAYPRRGRIVLIVLAVALAVWAFARLVWAGIRSHDI